MRVLGIDPGTVVMGYGVVEERGRDVVAVDYGALKAASRLPLAERLYSLFCDLESVILRCQPDELAVEEPFVAENVRSALAIGRAQAVAMLAASRHKLPVTGYAPAKVKQLIADYGCSDKQQMQHMISLQLNLPVPPEPADAADALAMALCHLLAVRQAGIISRSELSGR